MRTAPADEAVVTVTFASPNNWSSGPRSVSTVCTREIGAIRRSCTSQRVRVYTASVSISQRCTRYRHNGATTTNTTIPNTEAAAGRACTHGNRRLIADHTAWPAARMSQGVAAPIAQTFGALRLGGLAGATR